MTTHYRLLPVLFVFLFLADIACGRESPAETPPHSGSVSFQVEGQFSWPFDSVGSSFRKRASLLDAADSTTKEETLPPIPH